MRCTKICQQCLGTYSIIITLGCIIIDDIIHYSQEGIAIHILLMTHLLNTLIAKTKSYAKGVKTLKHAIIVADDFYHLIIRFVEFQSFHLLIIIHLYATSCLFWREDTTICRYGQYLILSITSYQHLFPYLKMMIWLMICGYKVGLCQQKMIYFAYWRLLDLIIILQSN